MKFRKQNFIKRFIKGIGHFLIFVLGSLIYCEYLHYYLVLSNCKWPVLRSEPQDDNQLHVMALADTHLLGNKKGHWFDKLRREWQMYRAFQTTQNLFETDVVIFLGDLFDEGKWSSMDEFSDYVTRFNSLFYVNPSTELIITAGNHDMGFHYSINSYMAKRFQDTFKTPSVYMKTIKGISFISINSMSMHGDECFLCKPARLKVESISRKLRCAQGFKDECPNGKIPITSPSNYSSPVILQHYPMFRESDSLCSEVDEAPQDEKHIQFREKWECLSKESSNMLLRELQPRLVLSGHTHHGCQTWHNISIKTPNNLTKEESILETTIPSFSWRNKKNPSFSMITISGEEYRIYKCQMPNEHTIYLLYVSFLISYILYLIKFKCRLTNFIYFKYYKEK